MFILAKSILLYYILPNNVNYVKNFINDTVSVIIVCTSVPLGTGILFRATTFPLNDPLCTVPYDPRPTNSLKCISLYGTESPV